MKINIAPGSTDPFASVLSYYDPTPKVHHETSQTFLMYSGLYYYLITRGDNQRFLRAKNKQDLKAKRDYTWENIPGLEERLIAVLIHNLKSNPFVEGLLATDIEAVWNDPVHGIAMHEERWLRVVNKALRRIRNT